MARTPKVVGHKPVAPKGPKQRSGYFDQVVPDFTPNHQRVCLLTGASGLLGTAFIKRCSLDYQIVAVHNKTDLATPQKLVDPLFPNAPIENPPVYSIRADLSQPSEIKRVVTEVLEKFKKVDVLINAACHRDWQSLLSATALDEVDLAFQLNVIAPLRLAHELIHDFWIFQSWEENDADNRNIINISSTAGSYVYPDSGQTLYSSTKAALNYVGHHMASELWDIGIRVNTVAPNTFPSIVSTEHVLDTMVAMDTGKETGQFIIIDKM
jgi:NAD(P)-dependent dehydrogenase (short-subunit alcohol dehydrogenase family)